ncbi:MAG: S8 family peptidase, partial [Candidatus Poseidoniales archaeon]
MSNLRAALLVIILLSADILVSVTAVGPQSSEPIVIDGLPSLQCGDELCLIPSRDIARGEHFAVESWGWWFSYGPDLDFNGMDDRLQYVMDGAESMSTTKILGPDGRSTVAITVDFAWHPTNDDITALKLILFAHGWVEDGSWFYVFDSVDSISLDHVPVSALIEIWSMEQVVVVEMQNVMVPSMETAAKAVRARDSDDYSGSLHDRGYDGSGVVIAVLDSGVDNEHRSLNDFDDKEDEPDLDSSSYSDQKWLAGYDATSQASNPDGTQDPDDGQGHGTHVAGIALGTGDSSRKHTGVAPGSFLVDIKVLTDSGGTNSQNSQSGMQWMINNRETEWPGTNDARGIQIGQMSFGSISSPFGDDSTGDNGTSTEARLINNATENGIICVIAIGNDGRHRVASPSSADGAITVAAADDRDSVNRTDDVKASYSNWGPRDDDGDEDEWDELKPDIISYGSGIMSATAATGTSLPGTPRPMADNEYDSKDGTSMSTPVVSGIVAIMLQADGSLTPQEVKDILRNSSEVTTDPSASSISDTWNDKWGFGLADASCAVDTVLKRKCTPLTDDGDGVIVDPPPSDDSVSATTINSPINGTWLIGGDMISFEGSMLASSTIEWDSVEISIEQRLEDDDPRILMDWTEVGGDIDSWFLDILIQNDWRRLDETFTLVKARAISESEDEISAEAYIWTRIGRMTASISSPSSTTDLVGAVSFSGMAEGVEHGVIEYQVNNDPWIEVMTLPELDYGSQEWSFNWDSTTVEDGTHKISVRMVNLTDV